MRYFSKTNYAKFDWIDLSVLLDVWLFFLRSGAGGRSNPAARP